MSGRSTAKTRARYPSPIDRLLARSVEDDDCWTYTGPTNASGYSRLRVGDGRKAFGHRVSYEFFIGPIPDGLTFDHLCRNTSCVNPWHGDLVPLEINSLRQIAGTGFENRNKTHCPIGHPLSGENLRFASGNAEGAPNGRVCRTCRAESCRRYRMKHQQVAA